MWEIAIGIGVGLVVTWLVLIAVLIAVRPRGGLLREALRILPDVLRLIRRLAADTSLPAGVRVRLMLLLAYLALPFDLIPDFVPVLGYADDAIVVVAVLRSVVRRAGLESVRRHWPGSDDGFQALCRITGLTASHRDPGQEAPTGDEIADDGRHLRHGDHDQ
ncbi:hypothetical protein AU196_11565 [Mycobacterium sp. IS-1742]|nr:hypothetical protein AU196_11565 [Mycobacterium sp. IS-1742]